MRLPFLAFVFSLLVTCHIQAQQVAEGSATSKEQTITQGTDQLPKQKSFLFERKATINLGEIKTDYAPKLMIREMPRQAASKVENQYRARIPYTARKSTQTLPEPVVGENFLANLFSVATPNDNDVAVSDSGMLISVINTNIFVRDIKNGVNKGSKSLFSFTEPINDLEDEFDPKVIYDPETDRFVLVCLVGYTDLTSKVILGFSTSNDPNKTWNLYELPGDALGNNLWSDYPMIALTRDELFLTVNLIYNDSSWQTGFVETIIWQMNKDSGYTGKSMAGKLHSNIRYNGRAIRNLCPVKGGSRLYGPDMYFISNRNLDAQNDTMFIVRVTDVLSSPACSVTVKQSRTNLPYQFPPDAVQKGTSELLACNDSRNLGAFYENGLIQFVHTTKHPVNNRPTVQYGVIYFPESNPIINGYLLENDTMDYAYPNISYAGLDSTDNTALIVFNHSSPGHFPGVSAVQADAYGDFSSVVRIREGFNYVDLLTSSLERWGDYTGSQRRYNKPGEVWVSGYIGYPSGTMFPKAHAAWVAQLTTQAGLSVNVAEIHAEPESRVFPNPVADRVIVELNINKPEYFAFDLYDSQGKLVANLMREWVKTNNIFSFRTADLAPGLYHLKITGSAGTNISRKVIVN